MTETAVDTAAPTAVAPVAIDLTPFANWENKKISLSYGIGDEVQNVEGVLMAVSIGQGIMFRKRGSQKPDLIKDEMVYAIAELAEAPKKVTSKKLKEVTLDDARAHLADRHGYKLADVNGATPEQAMLAHDQIDHTDLGHHHDSTAAEKEAAAEESIEAPADY